MYALKNGLLYSAVVGFVTFGFLGCGGEGESPSPAAGSPAAEIPDGMEDIAQLPQAEQQAALQQRICPVAEEPLGSMGKPIKVTVNERDVYVCCDSCIDTLKADPETYLAKLDQE